MKTPVTPTKKPPAPTPMTAQQQELLRNAGAGSLSDYARQAFAAGEDFTISQEEAAFHGAGFVQDVMKSIGPPTEPAALALTSLDPDTAVLGGADVTMTCNGTGFTETAMIIFAGQPEPIVFISDTQISTVVKPSLGWGAVSVDVFVTSAYQQTAALPFTFTEPAARKGK